VLVALSLSSQEVAGEVEQIRDNHGATPSEEAADFYNKIPGFAMTAGASEFDMSSVEDCKAKCSPDEECKSVSWNSAEGKCIISTEALSYDPNFTLFTKKTRDNSEYNSFHGLVYRETGRKPTIGEPQVNCESACTNDKSCKAFSYSNTDDQSRAKCWLSSQAISYNDNFVYYEKKGVDKQIAAQNEAADSGSSAPSVEEQATEDPEVKAFEIKEKAKEKEAAKAKAASKEEMAHYKSQRDEMRKEASEKIAQITGDATKKVNDAKAAAQKQVEKSKTEYKAQAAKDWERKKETLKLEFAASELRQKEAEKNTIYTEDQAEHERLALETKEIAEKASFGALSIGEKKAMLKAKDVKVEADKKAFEKAKENLKDLETHFNDGTTAGSKKGFEEQVAKIQAEAAQKAENLQKEVDEKAAENRKDAGQAGNSAESEIAKVRAEAAANVEKARQAAQDTCTQRVAERANKNAVNNQLLQNETQASLKESLERQAADEKAVDDANKAAQKSEQESLAAEAAAAQSQALAKVEEANAQVKAEQALAASKIKEQVEEQEKSRQLDEKKEEVKEEDQKRARAEQAAAKRAEAEAAKEAAERATKEATKASEGAQKVVKLADERSEKAAEHLAEQRKEHQELSAKSADKLGKYTTEVRKQLETKEKANKAEARRLREEAESEAASITSQADAEAEVVKQRAHEKANKHIEEKKSLAATSVGLMETVFKATEAAFVDSGSPIRGLDIADLKVNVQKSTAKYQNAVQEASNAKTEFEDAEQALATAQNEAGGASRRLLQDPNQAAVDEAAQAAHAQAELAAQNAQDQALEKEGENKKKAADEEAARKAAGAEGRNKDQLRARIAAAQAKKNKADEEATALQQAVTLSQQAVASASLLDSNTAFGKLPEKEQLKGFLRVQASPEHEQDAYIKFPVVSLSPTDVITDATLRVFKFGGGEGPAIVKLSSCAWSRESITYSIAQDFAAKTVSTTTAMFPDVKDVWVRIPLDGNAIQEARLAGDSVCLRLSGGPASDPVILSSEMTASKPEINIMYKKNDDRVAEEKAELGTARNAVEEEGTALARTQFEQHKQAELHKKFTNQLLGENQEALAKKLSENRKSCDGEVLAATTGPARTTIENEEHIAAQGVIQQRMAQKKQALDAEDSENSHEDKDAELHARSAEIEHEETHKASRRVEARLVDIRDKIENKCKEQENNYKRQLKNLTPEQEAEVTEHVKKGLNLALAAWKPISQVESNEAQAVGTLEGDSLE
jgi:hypothetical protein